MFGNLMERLMPEPEKPEKKESTEADLAEYIKKYQITYELSEDSAVTLCSVLPEGSIDEYRREIAIAFDAILNKLKLEGLVSQTLEVTRSYTYGKNGGPAVRFKILAKDKISLLPSMGINQLSDRKVVDASMFVNAHQLPEKE